MLNVVFYLNMLNDIVLIVVKLYVVATFTRTISEVRFAKMFGILHFKAKRSLNFFILRRSCDCIHNTSFSS